MKNWFRWMLVIAVAALLTIPPALAETKISVTGTGETQVSADTAIISLGVSAQDKDVLTAQQRVNETIAAIRKALIDHGIKEDCINTDYINIYAVYDYEQLTGYNASSTLAIKTADVESVGALIDASFFAGANTLNGITFSASNTEKAKAESLKKAVVDARTKAEMLAEASGLTITGMDAITEDGVYSYNNTVENYSSADVVETVEEDAGTVVHSAKLIVSANVTISFEAE